MAHIPLSHRPIPSGKLAPLTSQVLPPELAPALPDDFPLPDMPVRQHTALPAKAKKKISRQSLGMPRISMRKYEMPASRVAAILLGG